MTSPLRLAGRSPALSSCAHAETFASGGVSKNFETLAVPAANVPRDVFLYVISGFKKHDPRAAQALIERVEKRI
jgi:hypothetical protein